jgi:EpsI family protein
MRVTTTRVLIVAALVVVVHAVFLIVRTGGMPTDFTELKGDLGQAIPNELGRWKGESTELDPTLTEATDAEVVVERLYRDVPGNVINLHVNTMRKFFTDLRHNPEHCYTSHGYQILERKPTELQIGGQTGPRVMLLTVDENGNRVMVMYWYHFGDEVIREGAELRKARWALRGRKTWPPLIKVMLQTPAPDAEMAEARLKDFAEQLYPLTEKYNRQTNLPE